MLRNHQREKCFQSEVYIINTLLNKHKDFCAISDISAILFLCGLPLLIQNQFLEKSNLATSININLRYPLGNLAEDLMDFLNSALSEGFVAKIITQEECNNLTGEQVNHARTPLLFQVQSNLGHDSIVGSLVGDVFSLDYIQPNS